MMKRIKTALFLTLIFALLIGCGQLPLSPTGNATETQYPAATPAGTSILTETRTPDVPKEIVSPIDSCLTVESRPISNWNSEGILILKGTEGIGNNLVKRMSYKINMATSEIVGLSKPEERLSDLAVSPDGKWLAYRIYSTNNKNADLVISNAANEQHLIIPWENEWYWIASWLDENKLMIGVGADSYLVFNPFTNERLLLNSELPNIFNAQGFSGLVGGGYNKNLNQVVYVQGDPLFLEPLHYVLWDIDQRRSLASFEVAIEVSTTPRWSPSSDEFAIALSLNVEKPHENWSAYELYSVSREGQVIQVTNLTDDYPWVYIEDYSWSPDGRYIAFWFSWWTEQLEGFGLFDDRYLAVVDTEFSIVTNYCIKGNPENSGKVPPPVWSPNGEQLVIESPSSEDHSQVVLIDLKSQKAFQIGKDMKPVGWMVAP
jgi:hypothetical protein